MLRNYTPHPVVIEGMDPIPSEGIARVAEQTVVIGMVGNVPAVQTTFGDVEGLPDPDGSIFIVSGMVLDAAKASGRTDCAAPYTGTDPVYGPNRDGGRIVSVKALRY